MPKLSIITINLNNAKGLEKTIESVIDQTFTDFEYIIIDGNSTDDSVSIIKQYEKKIDYWISEPDKGIYNAMNKGILKATGEYCYFLNSGDVITNNNVLKEVFNDSERREDILYGNHIKIYAEGKMIKVKAKTDLSMIDFFHKSPFCHQAAILKRGLFLTHGLYNEGYKNISDWQFFVENMIMRNCTSRYVDIDMVYFDVTGVSSSNYTLTVAERNNWFNSSIPRFQNDYYLFKEFTESDFFPLFVKAKKNKLVRYAVKLLRKLLCRQ
jgi:glycosyltransferase involved in cell wall biosynthesis